MAKALPREAADNDEEEEIEWPKDIKDESFSGMLIEVLLIWAHKP